MSRSRKQRDGAAVGIAPADERYRIRGAYAALGRTYFNCAMTVPICGTAGFSRLQLIWGGQPDGARDNADPSGNTLRSAGRLLTHGIPQIPRPPDGRVTRGSSAAAAEMGRRHWRDRGLGAGGAVSRSCSSAWGACLVLDSMAP